jgi:hypothetical protein
VKLPDPVQTFDIGHYSDGRPYVVTDHGPNVWGACGLCGAPAACTPDMRLSDVRCGQCLLIQFQMVPAQRIYEAKAEYARLHGPRSFPLIPQDHFG